MNQHFIVVEFMGLNETAVSCSPGCRWGKGSNVGEVWWALRWRHSWGSNSGQPSTDWGGGSSALQHCMKEVLLIWTSDAVRQCKEYFEHLLSQKSVRIITCRETWCRGDWVENSDCSKTFQSNFSFITRFFQKRYTFNLNQLTLLGNCMETRCLKPV